MAGSKRERELARAKYERQQARRAEQAGRRRRNQRIIAVVVVVALVVASLAWVILSRASSQEVTAESATPAASPSASAPSAAAPSDAASSAAPEQPASSAAPSATVDPALGEASVLDCTAPGPIRSDDIRFDTAPTDAATGSITFATNCGDIVVALDPAATATTASMAYLAQQGFFDATACHRLTTAGIFVLQCGDPAGNGTGGAGYTLPDENLPPEGEANYPAGTVAMANAGPGTGSSQFFIVYDDTTLPSGYTIWGQVTEGLDIVKEIASVGVADGTADGSPRQPVVIESATFQPN